MKTITKLCPPVLAVAMVGCASTTAYYPPIEVFDSKGRSKTLAAKAFQTYGDSIGNTSIDISHSGIRYAAAGGNMNSPTTALLTHEVGQTVRTGFAWGFGWAMAKAFFSSVLNPIVTKAPVTAAAPAAAKAQPLPTVGSTIPAQTQATVSVPAAEVIPAAGTTIPATVPSIITPIP